MTVAYIQSYMATLKPLCAWFLLFFISLISCDCKRSIKCINCIYKYSVCVLYFYNFL